MVRWQDALKLVPGLQAIDSLQPEKSPILEELNLAWARHEIISDHVDEVRLSHASNLALCRSLRAWAWNRFKQKYSDVRRSFCQHLLDLGEQSLAWVRHKIFSEHEVRRGFVPEFRIYPCSPVEHQ